MRDLHVTPKEFEIPKNTGRAILLDYYEGEPDFLFHYHSEFELVMTRGSFGRRLIGNVISDYTVTDLVLLGPHLPHTWASEPTPNNGKKMDNIVVHFSRQSVGMELLGKPEFAAVNEMLHKSVRGLHFVDAATLSQAEALLETIVRQEGEGLPQFLTFLALLSLLAASGDPREIVLEDYDYSAINHEHEPFTRIINYLHKRRDEPITVNEIAAEAHMSVPTFCRFFKRMTGTTFVDYLNSWRIDRACIFLQETDLSILDIALHVGFHNLSNFNRQFKRRKHLTPREFRRASESDPSGSSGGRRPG